MFELSDKFVLKLKWKAVVYERPNVCKIEGAYFSGPVLQIAQKVNSNDSMSLDVFSQYIHLVQAAYVVKLKWGEAVYSDDGKSIKLNDCFISHESELNKVPVLKNSDWFMIDTSKHTADIHAYNFVYTTYVMNSEKDLYRFEK